MEVEIIFRGEAHEIEDRFGVSLHDSERNTGEPDADELLTNKEEQILQTVRDNPGKALRTIQKKAAKLEDSPWEFSGKWDSDRKDVRRILQTLKSRDLVRLDKRSYYPADHDAVAD